MRKSPEVVKREVNEVQEAVNHENIMIEYHALAVFEVLTPIVFSSDQFIFSPSLILIGEFRFALPRV